MTQQSPPEKGPEPLERLRKGWKYLSMFGEVASPKNLVVFLVALVLVAIGLVGGWGRVEAVKAEIPLVEVKKPVEAAPFTITLLDAWVTQKPPKSVYATGQSVRLIMVRGTLTNTANIPVDPGSELGQTVQARLPGCQYFGKAKPEEGCLSVGQYRTHDFTREDAVSTMGAIQPGVPMGFVMVFAQSLTVPAPTALDLTVSSLTYRNSNLEDTKFWADQTPVGRIELPVRAWSAGSWGTP